MHEQKGILRMKSRKLGVYIRVLAPIIVLLTISAVLYAQTAWPAQPVVGVQSASPTGVIGFTPAEIRHAYGFDQIPNQGEGQTIAVVTAFDDAVAEQDLAVFNLTFGLPPCTTANLCFQKVNLGAAGPIPPISAFEAALGVEWPSRQKPKYFW